MAFYAKQNLTIPYPLLVYIIENVPGDVAQKIGSTCKYLMGMVERSRSGNLPPKLVDYILRRAPAKTLNKIISTSKYFNQRSYEIRGRAIDCLAIDFQINSDSEVHETDPSNEVVMWIGRNYANELDVANISLNGSLEVFYSRALCLQKIFQFRHTHITRVEFSGCKLNRADFFAIVQSKFVEEVITEKCIIVPNVLFHDVLNAVAHVKQVWIDIVALKYKRSTVHPLLSWKRSQLLDLLVLRRLNRSFTLDTCLEVIDKHGGYASTFVISFHGKTADEHEMFQHIVNLRVNEARQKYPDSRVGLAAVLDFRCEQLQY